MDRRELEEYKFQLAAVNDSLEADPKNESLLTLRSELTDLIALLEQAVAAADSQASSAQATSKSKHGQPGITPFRRAAPTAKPVAKNAPDRSPGSVADNRVDDIRSKPQAQSSSSISNLVPPPPPPPSMPPPPPEDQMPQPSAPPRESYNVGSIVMARWLSGDKQYHRAKVTGITGSSTQPMFTVKFFDHPSTDTVPLSCLRVAANQDFKRDLKRKAIEPVRDTKAPTSAAKAAIKAAKLEEKKAIDNSKAKWQEFSSKGFKASKFAKAKKIGETSMFKSPDDVTGRVGVINSGKPMTNNMKRSKHVYNVDNGSEV